MHKGLKRVVSKQGLFLKRSTAIRMYLVDNMESVLNITRCPD